MATGAFGDDTESSVLFSVQCFGNETEIMDCTHSTNESGVCSSHSAAVVCQGRVPVMLIVMLLVIIII